MLMISTYLIPIIVDIYNTELRISPAIQFLLYLEHRDNAAIDELAKSSPLQGEECGFESRWQYFINKRNFMNKKEKKLLKEFRKKIKLLEQKRDKTPQKEIKSDSHMCTYGGVDPTNCD